MLFSEDYWLQGFRVLDLAPNLLSQNIMKSAVIQSLFEALQGGTWALDVSPDIGEDILLDFLVLWNRTVAVQLLPTTQDCIS